MSETFQVELSEEAITDMKRNPEIVPIIKEALLADIESQIDDYVKEEL